MAGSSKRKRGRTAPQGDGIAAAVAQERALVAAAMTLAVEQGWRDLPLQAIAERAGVPLQALYPRCRHRNDVLVMLARQADAAVLEAVGQDATEPDGLLAETSPRDRLFDVMMCRLDALAPYKAGLAVVAADLGRDPAGAIAGIGAVARSMAWMLEAAGIPAAGVSGLLRARLLAVAYLLTLRTWLADDSPDQARTMAALDAGLRRLERLGRIWRR